MARAGSRLASRPMLEAPPLERLVTALRDPRRYPHPVDRVEVLETHISLVLLAGEHAYKLKKPLDLGFLDFSTLEKRREACEAELRLNRRMAPMLYLDVVPIGGTPDEPHLGAEPAIEYAVKMWRFEQDNLLDRVAARGALTPAQLEALAYELAGFHARVPFAEDPLPYGLPEQLLAPMAQNFSQFEELVEAVHDREALERLRHWTERTYARLHDTFVARRAAGRVRECHGDLHLGNLVLVEGRAVAFDCIEFNADLRWSDVMSEIAFLVMDLLDHGHHPLAHRFLDAYLAATGDYAGLAVLPFYLVHRAMVRAKIACLRAHQPGLDVHGRTRADAEYHDYLRLAETLSAPGHPGLVLMHGLSASGKSFTALRLVERAGAIRVRSDLERKRLHGLAWNASTRSALGAGLYGREASRRTYQRLTELAGSILDAGYFAVMDATFLRWDEREAFRRLAASRRVPFAIVSCTADEATLRQRLTARSASRDDPSEATLTVLEHQLATQEPLTDAERPETLVVDTTAPDEQLDRSLAALAAKLGR
jgi:uncharacterized protein